MSIQPHAPSLEWWDVYDHDRRPTGRVHPRGVPLPPGDFHLVVHVCIFNSRGELLLQKRHPAKQEWANYWDISAAGSALAGEDSRAAAVRETREELGLEIDLDGLRPRFSFTFTEGFDDFWYVERDVAIAQLTFQPLEVSDAKWAGREEVQRMQHSGELVPFVFLSVLFDLRRTAGGILPPGGK